MANVIDDIDFSRYLRDTQTKTLVRKASAYLEQMEDYLLNGPGTAGDLLPWAKTDGDVRLRPGEVSIWAGVNGHGKSLKVGQIVLGLMRQRRRCLIASFEMKPKVTLARMCRQASQGSSPSSEFNRQFARWTDELLWMYDHQGMVAADQVAAVCRWASQELGMQHIVIDSLMKCVRGEKDYDAQKDFVDQLTVIARDTEMHIHLVHHLRKGDNEDDIGGKFDLKGSGSIADQVDNVFVVWRNKKKQFTLQAGGEVKVTDPDSMLICEKQRNGEWEGRIALWFDKGSMQYVGAPNERPSQFVPWRP